MTLEPKIVRRSRILTRPVARQAPSALPAREPMVEGAEPGAAKRPILKLKFPPAVPATLPSAATVKTASASASLPSGPQWKCKPCGALIVLTGSEPDDAVIRCPSCNARLGVAAHFKAEAPDTAKVRARRVS